MGNIELFGDNMLEFLNGITHILTGSNTSEFVGGALQDIMDAII